MDSTVSVFISHNKEDETLALLLKEFLEGLFLNMSVFVSTIDLTGGEVWIEELRKRLHQATAIVALITPTSANSRWVLFEAGAGFCAQKTIPLLGDELSFEDLDPPLKLLQGRQYSTEGLCELATDIARLARLRVPAKFQDVHEVITKAQNFTRARRDAEMGTQTVRFPLDQAVIEWPPEEVSSEPEVLDPMLHSTFQELQTRLHNLMVISIDRARATFELPPREDLEGMSLQELDEIAQAVNAPCPIFLPLQFAFAEGSVPRQDDTIWKKMNAEKRFEDVRRQLDHYEASLDSATFRPGA